MANVPKLQLPSAEWQVLANSGYVREKFLNFTPDDAADMSDVNALRQVRELYTPSSQPQTLQEYAYLDLVIEAINTRLREL